MGGTGEVAIVGMACVMPGAPDVEAFWANIVDGVDSVTEVPSSRWTHDRHFDPDYDSSVKGADREPMSVSKWGGFVPDVGFDALTWGIPPASLASIDPAQLLALKVAGAALDNAGYSAIDSFDRERASVIYATGSGGAADLPAGFILRLLLRNHGITADMLPAELDAFLPNLTEDGLPGVLTSVIAGRVANRLDLGGKNLTVDSACASVLVALDIACNELTGRSSDLVLCGGVDLHNGAQDYVSFTAAQALSRSGRCRAFDTSADGMTLAEGVGCVVLKRLDDAERDGDRIYAVVRGVAGSSDGRHLGLTAPRQEGQVRAVRRAYAAAGVSPTEIGLVEAHGTGTPTGDRTELDTTTEVFAEAGVAPGTVVIGSVKSNIGHIKCASAMAALIKAAKCAYHGVQPATLHIKEPIDVWDPETSPFVFLDASRPWLDEKRLVAVSSFGFGGTNFCAILENHRGAPGAGSGSSAGVSGRPHWPSEVVAFRAGDDAELGRRLDELSSRLTDELGMPLQADRWRLRDVAASVSGTGSGPVRLALVADDLDDLAAKVTAAREGRPIPRVYRSGEPTDDSSAPGVAFLFAGGASARPGMAAETLVAFPQVRDVASGRPWSEVMWPAQAFGDDGARQQAALADVADPAAAVAGLAAARALASLGIAPDRIAGLGSPLVASPDGAAALCAALRVAAASHASGDADLAPDTSGHAPAGTGDGPPTADTSGHAPDGSDDAAGSTNAGDEDRAGGAEIAGGGRIGWPEAAASSDSPMHAAGIRASEMGGLPVADSKGAEALRGLSSRDRDGFVDEVRALAAQGIGIFVEVGPGQVLTGLVDEALADVPHLAVATDQVGEHDITTLLHTVARLAVAGVDVDLDALHAGRGSRPERWSEPTRRAGWIVNGHFARTAAGEPLPKGLRPASEAPVLHIGGGEKPAADAVAAQANGSGNGNGHANGNGSSLSDSDLAVVTEYLRIIQGMITTGSEIIRGHVEAGQS